jgi:uncharacterized coiled-coil DUF342 family protein
MSRYGTRYSLSDREMALLLAQRGNEVRELRDQVDGLTRERDALRAELDALKAQAPRAPRPPKEG